MTEEAGTQQPADDARVDQRADEMWPEEQAAGSEDPQAQAQAILAESDERTDHPQEAQREYSQTIESDKR